MCDSKREILLKKLHSIQFWAYLVYLPSEMCIELTVFTSSGLSQEWIGEDDWNVYRLRPLKQTTWELIYRKQKDKALLYEDLRDTDFEKVIQSCYGEINNYDANCSLKLDGIKTLTESLCGDVFCYKDFNDKLVFFRTEAEICNALSKIYNESSVEWDSLDTEELLYWISVYESEGPNIPCFSFE